MKKMFKTLLAVIIAVVMSLAVLAIAGCDKKNDDTPPAGSGTLSADNSKLINTDYKAISADINLANSEEGIKISLKANLDGSADFTMAGFGSGYFYAFVRDWKVYMAETETETTDFTSAELEGLFDINDVIKGILEMDEVVLPDNVVDLINIDDGVKGTLGAVNYFVLGLAEASGAVTESNGTVTADLNLAVYNAVKDIKEAVDTITAETTVGQLLANEKLAKYLKIFTELVKPEEVLDLLKETVDSVKNSPDVSAEVKAMAQQISSLLDACQPEEGSSTLEYILKLLTDLGYGERKISDILTMLDPELTVNAVKQTVAGMASLFEADKIKTGNGSVENLKMVYTYTGDRVLTSQKLTAKITAEGGAINADATISYSAEKYTDLKALPAQLPEIPAFDPDDWFGKPGNPEIPDVTVTNGTPANAGGTVTITPQNVKLGDTVTITVEPDDTHILGALTVSGGVTAALQQDGTYTFVATQKQYTVTATFIEKPAQEVEASVSGQKYDGTQIEIAEGTSLVFTPKSGAPVTLNVNLDKKIKGALLPGKYTVTAEGYYAATVTVADDYTIENGITLKKLVFETNAINHNDNYLQGAANSDPQKVAASEAGKIYEWSIDEYSDVAVSFIFKRIDSGVQGILMDFGNGKAVIVRFENINEGTATKAQRCGMAHWGVTNINGDWDFGNGEENANPLSSNLYADYTGEDGVKLTLVRKGGYVYALIGGTLYSSQRVFDYTNAKVKFALFVEDAKAGYEIPFEITTNVDSVLASAGILTVLNGCNGSWTESEGKLTATGGDCYAQFAAPAGTVKESATMKISKANGGDQGFVYQFADGKHLGVRYQYENGNCKVQYYPDPSFLGSDNTLSAGGWQGYSPPPGG